MTKPRKQEPTARVDERDTMFARMARKSGTAEYNDYYGRREELKTADDHLRAMTPLLAPGALCYHPKLSAEAERYFKDIHEIEIDRKVVDVWRERLATSQSPTTTIKEMVRVLGGVAVGCTTLEKEYIYTHKGRFDADYGQPIELDHPSVIVFLVEMDFDAMQCSPRAETIRESARQYYRAALISQIVEEVLSSEGYAAKAHYDAHYDVILPPLAVKAGLGELGRNNILVSEHYGSRVRIGGVTTNFPLTYDAPIDLGVQHFCDVCKKCAENCPSRALTLGDKVNVRGVEKWPTNVERCHGYWRAVGTDCGVCMATCPYSHENNWFHNSVRFAIRRAPWLHRPAVFFDNLVYGRTWRSLTNLPPHE